MCFGSMPARGVSKVPWLMVTAKVATHEVIVAALRAGAADVISTEDKAWVERVMQRLDEALVEAEQPPVPAGFVAQSAAARELLQRLRCAAGSALPVLLTGETGTGKELASRLIHQWSARGKKAFVPINCAAIPNELMEAELFGYTKGAFSGAVRDYDGQVAAAEGGSVLFDEIDDTPASLQVKLLRVLEDRVISRLGENVWRKVDFRTIAATNRDLRGLVEKGQFGDDLYERLAVIQIELPPLRERLEDLPQLVQQLIERFYVEDPGALRRHHVREVTPQVLEVLRHYPWPGNVRELRNVVHAALVWKQAGHGLFVADLPKRVWSLTKREKGAELFSEEMLQSQLAQRRFNLKNAVAELERRALQLALRQTSGNAAAAAKLLGTVGRGKASDPGGTLRRMMRRLHIDRPT